MFLGREPNGSCEGVLKLLAPSVAHASLQAFARLVRLIPPRWYGPIATIGGGVFWLIGRKHRSRTLANLHAHGLARRDARRLAVRSFRSNFLVLLETLSMDRLLGDDAVTLDCDISPRAAATFAAVRAGEVPMTVSARLRTATDHQNVGAAGEWALVGERT